MIRIKLMMNTTTK